MLLKNKKINLFARQLILKDFGEKKQKIISKSHITFIGMGGINCPAVIYLLSAGINNITIIDHDAVTYSNLNRQILYSFKDIGKSKVKIAKKNLKKIYPNLKIKYFEKKITKKNCKDILSKTSLIIDGTDNWETMLNINDHCVKKNIPLLTASVVGYDGNLMLFKNNKKNHLCLRCIFPNKKQVSLPRCETVGVLGTSAGIIGLLTAHKVINFLINKKSNKYESIMYFEGKDFSFSKIKLSKNTNCKLIK